MEVVRPLMAVRRSAGEIRECHGDLHLGNVCAFAMAWLSARTQGGRVLLRVEDVDRARVNVLGRAAAQPVPDGPGRVGAVAGRAVR